MADFVIPELGENIAGGDIVRVLVKPGDAIKKDQPVLELETDKATIEVPSSVAGVVKELKVKTGDKVKVGQLVLTVDESGCGRSAAGSATPAAASARQGSRREAKGGGAKPRRPGCRQARGSRRRGAAAGRRRADPPSKVVDIGRGAPARPAAAASAAGAPLPGGGGLCRPRPPLAAPLASWAWTSRKSKAAVPAAASPWTT